MPNLHRGEIEAEIGGARRRLVLTLGALAELEAAFGADDLVALAERFGAGRLKARDLVAHHRGRLARGRRNGDRRRRRRAHAAEDGAQGYVRIAAALIAATFGADDALGKRRARTRAPPGPPQRSREPAGFGRSRGGKRWVSGLGVLRLSSDPFWRMTPRELAARSRRWSAAGRADRPCCIPNV